MTGRRKVCDNVKKKDSSTGHVAERASSNKCELEEQINEDIHIPEKVAKETID
jgi:hypothetical protein